MSKRIKRIMFSQSGYGLRWVDINTQTWQVVDACSAGRHIIGRACRLAERGSRFEYRTANGYQRINAVVEMME